MPTAWGGGGMPAHRRDPKMLGMGGEALTWPCLGGGCEVPKGGGVQMERVGGGVPKKGWEGSGS